MNQATQLFNRLTENEKMDLRSANEGRLMFMAHNSFNTDMPLESLETKLAVVKAMKPMAVDEMTLGYEGFQKRVKKS